MVHSGVSTCPLTSPSPTPSAAMAARYYWSVRLPIQASSGLKRAAFDGPRMKAGVLYETGRSLEMSLVYIFAASPMEGEPVRKIAPAADSGVPARCGANDVVLIFSGM